MIQCKSCGYPVIKGMHICPNCLAEMPNEIVASLHIEEETYEYNEDEIPICSLRSISLPNERKMPKVVYEEGAEIYLSRENTVPHDNSIDDEEQASLFFSDGHWLIEDRLCDNSTYVHAGASIKQGPGDIVAIWNGRPIEEPLNKFVADIISFTEGLLIGVVVGLIVAAIGLVGWVAVIVALIVSIIVGLILELFFPDHIDWLANKVVSIGKTIVDKFNLFVHTPLYQQQTSTVLSIN